ncbi:eCIS core domain-containing protein [Haliangium sp.]
MSFLTELAMRPDQCDDIVQRAAMAGFQIGGTRPSDDNDKAMPASEHVHHAAEAGVSGNGGTLPHLERIQQSFGPGHDVSNIKAHVGGAAAEASEAIGASAYATGDRVAFRSAPDLHTAAHEAAHVIQQQQGVQLQGGVGQVGDAYERHADAVADRVVAGQSAAEVLTGGPMGSGRMVGSRGVQLSPDGAAAQRGVGQEADRQAQEHGHDSAPTLLYFVQGEQIILAPKPESDDRVQAAFDAAGAGVCPVTYSEVVPGDPSWPLFYALYLDQAGLDGEIDWQSVGRAAGDRATANGLVETPQPSSSDSIAQGAPMQAGSLQPGPWSPPGNQPIPLYIGTQAHLAISAYYETHHAGQVVFTNYTPLSTIVKRLTRMGIPGLDLDALREGGGLLRPDILNLTKSHLYEIKPAAAAAAALTEANLYIAALARAGLVVTLGPTAEPGTQGTLPAPDGFFRFWSPMAGVIIYQYRKKQPAPLLEPVRVTAPQEQEQPEFDMKRIWEWEYWEEVTGLTGAALVLYLVLSEGSRLYPPRNLVPVP